jgi:SAM-dependent methyltransferase
MSMTLDQAVETVRRTFPHPKYIHEGRVRAWRHVARQAAGFVPPGGAVLDFGSGPCDAAAVLSLMGYKVSAGDDLLDTWHMLPGMREKILNFARDTGVDFTLIEEGKPLPWNAGGFDMVMLNHVLEHIGESPRELMLAMVARLKDGGHVLVNVPSAVNIRKRLDVLRGRTNYPDYDMFYWYPSPWRGHRREYCKHDLERLSANLGLTTRALFSYHYMLQVVPKPMQGPYKLATAIFPGWRDSWTLVAQKPAGWKAPRESDISRRHSHAHESGDLAGV